MKHEDVRRVCIYCGDYKESNEFDEEHIWPDALGGDFLSQDLWRTTDVCRKCNNMSGVFVDGLFIRSFMGNAERSMGARDYLNPQTNLGALPLDFLGRIKDIPTPKYHVADYWAGPCGANIVHIRPADEEKIWRTYAAGDPRAKRLKAGRVYMALNSRHPFWVTVSLNSLRQQFKRARRFVVNAEVPQDLSSLVEMLDRNDPVQREDLKAVDKVDKISRTEGANLKLEVVARLDAGDRLLAKLGLALGYKLFGRPFTETDYAKLLRQAFRQPDPEVRQRLGIRGTRFATDGPLDEICQTLKWRGGWTLLLKQEKDALILVVIAPSGNSMSVVVCNDPDFLAGLHRTYENGVVWITVPPLAEAVGPLGLPEYLAHIDGQSHDGLQALANKRQDPRQLPPCGT